MRKLILVTITALASSITVAEDNLCQVSEARENSNWKISEEAFTKEKAEIALGKLKDAVEAGSNDPADYLYSLNQMILVKGYLLKQSTSPYSKSDVAKFCKFLESEAYVRH